MTMRYHITLLFIIFILSSPFLSSTAYGQERGSQDFGFGIGVWPQTPFYLFTKGYRNYILYADYKKRYKRFFSRSRITFANYSYGNITVYDDANWGYPTEGYTWIEAGHTDKFLFKDKVIFDPKAGLKSIGVSGTNANYIQFALQFGYILKIKKWKRLQLEPAIGYALFYFRDDYTLEQYNGKIGTFDHQNNNVPSLQLTNFSTNRGLINSFSSDIALRYYLKKRYSVGLNATLSISPYFNDYNYCGFIGFNF